METSIVGVGVGVTDRFRSVVEEKAVRIEHLAPRAQRLDIKVTHRAYHNGRVEDETVELTLVGKGPVVRAEAVDGDKFAALDLAVDKMAAQMRRAADRKRVHRGRRTPVSVGQALAAVGQGMNGDAPDPAAEPAEHQVGPLTVTGDGPMVVREKTHVAAPMSLAQALYEMELVGHDFFLFVDEDTNNPSVVYRRKGYDYGVISLRVG
jgi:ribosomal subunit interface protein